MRIRVSDLIKNTKAYSTELGIKVRKAYGDSWKTDKVILDFDGILNASPSFLSQATMPILMGVEIEDLDKRLEFENPPVSLESNWHKVIAAIQKQKSAS